MNRFSASGNSQNNSLFQGMLWCPKTARLAYTYFGLENGSLISWQTGINFGIWRATTPGSWNQSPGVQALDGTSIPASGQPTFDFAGSSPTLTTQLIEFPLYFKSSAQWAAKRGKEFNIIPTSGFCLTRTWTGIGTTPFLDMTFHWDE